MDKDNIKEITVAFITTNPDTLNGCPSSGFSKIKVVADTAWNIYHNPLPPKPISVIPIEPSTTINLFPNPAHDYIYIENSNSAQDLLVCIYNVLGQKMNVGVDKSNNKVAVEVSKLPAGVYHVSCNDGVTQKTVKFVKE